MSVAGIEKKRGQVIRLIMESYDHETLDKAVSDVLRTLQEEGAQIRYVGPIPLPTECTRVTVCKAPNANKDAREQYEIRKHRRVTDIDLQSVDIKRLEGLDLSAGVRVRIKLRN